MKIDRELIGEIVGSVSRILDMPVPEIMLVEDDSQSDEIIFLNSANSYEYNELLNIVFYKCRRVYQAWIARYMGEHTADYRAEWVFDVLYGDPGSALLDTDARVFAAMLYAEMFNGGVETERFASDEIMRYAFTHILEEPWVSRPIVYKDLGEKIYIGVEQ